MNVLEAKYIRLHWVFSVKRAENSIQFLSVLKFKKHVGKRHVL
jgi:hypothetical protein